MTADIDTMISIAHSFLGSDAFDFDCEEIPSVVMLAVARERLVSDGDRPDTRNEKGREEWASFLKLVEKTAVALNLDSYPREYRSKFAADLRAMFSESERSYRVDILEAALSFTPTLMVNGVAYQLSETVVDHSKALREMWLDLGELLDQWVSPDRALGQARAELCARLLRLDVAWAEFEEAYVEGLSLAQQHAKGALARACQQERRLRSAERRCAGGAGSTEAAVEECRREEAALLKHLAHLSAAAGNPRPSTQVPEFAVQILDEAGQLLAVPGTCCDTDLPDPTVVLAARAMESYKGLREYLVRVRKHLDKVRPQLGKNAGLVENLARWEESWERLAFYTEKPDLMEGVRLLVGFLAGALDAAPSLQQMLEDRDAELFLVLPRLACLCLLSDPESPVAQLLRPLLPSLFAADSEGDEEDVDQGPFTDALAASAELERVLDLLGGPADHDGAWDALARRAVAGAGAQAAADLCPEADPGQQEAVAGAVEGLMREVEGWSMELQRHHPAAWNDLSDLLVRCTVWRPDGAGDAEQAPAPRRFVL